MKSNEHIEHSVAQKAGKAGVLLLLRKTWGAILHLCVMAYLARTLTQTDFGLVAISGSLIGFIQTLGTSGIGEFIVFYRGDQQDDVRNSAFWLQMIMTALVVLSVAAVAPLWAAMYEDKRIIGLICLLSLSFIGSMVATIPIAIFRKSLDYRPLVTIQSAFGTISQLSQAGFAFLGCGVYSLTLPNAIVDPLIALTLLWQSGFRPRLSQGISKHWGNIFSYTKHVIGTHFLGKLANDGDTLLVGKLLGMQALGVYDVAFRLANLFSTHLLPILGSVSMPVFTQHKSDLNLVKKHYLKLMELISFTFFPLIGGMILFADDIVGLLYGPKWNAAILPLQILCVFVILRTLSSPTSGLYNALGKPHIGFYFTAVFTPLLLLALYIGAYFGLTAACVTVTAVRSMGSLVHFFLATRMLHATWQEFWASIRAPALSTLFALLIIHLIPWESSLLLVPCYAVILSLTMWFVFRRSLVNTFALIWRLTPRKAAVKT